MKISEIYKKYSVPDNLAAHQILVTSVGLVILENLDDKIDRNSIIAALLLHDVGNLVKFQNITDSNLLKVQTEFRQKYGFDSHLATCKIIEELKLRSRVRELAEAVDLNNAINVLRSGDISKMICAYSDKIVSPSGIVTVDERMKEVFSRNGKNIDDYEAEIIAMKEIEQVIQSHCKLNLNEINQSQFAEKLNELNEFEI